MFSPFKCTNKFLLIETILTAIKDSCNISVRLYFYMCTMLLCQTDCDNLVIIVYTVFYESETSQN